MARADTTFTVRMPGQVELPTEPDTGRLFVAPHSVEYVRDIGDGWCEVGMRSRVHRVLMTAERAMLQLGSCDDWMTMPSREVIDEHLAGQMAPAVKP